MRTTDSTTAGAMAPADLSTSLPCHVCGYDLRAAEAEGVCPECGGSVAEARRQAAIPRRPAWRESDPRWRRRMLAGVWILTLLPIVDASIRLDWITKLRVPTIFPYPGGLLLEDTLLAYEGVYQPVLLCMGVVLLFSRERDRQKSRLDWTRRWGVLCSYVIALINAAGLLSICSLISAGVAAVFHSMPIEHKPSVTWMFVDFSYYYLHYGPQPNDHSGGILVGFSSGAMLLACVPLFNALRSCGPRWLAMVMPVPIAGVALFHVGRIVLYLAGILNIPLLESWQYSNFFKAEWLARLLDGASTIYGRQPLDLYLFIETIKWASIAGTAIWLTIAQVLVWRRKSSTATN